jgi:hypothetical protein
MSSNTGENRKPGTFQPGAGKDTRINRKGRPKSFDAFRALAQQVAHELVMDDAGEPLVVDGHFVTATENILREWIRGDDPKMQQAALEVAYGKTPNALEVTGKGGERLIPIREIIVELPAEDTNAE